MEVIRGRERGCRQEIRCAVELGRACSTAQLNDLIHKGKRSAQLLAKAHILLKSDVSEAGEGWSDSRIAEALDTSLANILRTRRQLVEEGFEAVLRSLAENTTRAPPGRVFLTRRGSEIDRADMRAWRCGLRQLDPAPARGESR